jgi:DNA-binding response OmpR family regulator
MTQTIQTILDESVGAFRFGEVELDVVRREVRRCGEPIQITRTEFDLLCAFVRMQGVLLTRKQLLDQIRLQVFITERGIDNFVMNLRKKLEPNPTQPQYFITVRGNGYRFESSRTF